MRELSVASAFFVKRRNENPDLLALFCAQRRRCGDRRLSLARGLADLRKPDGTPEFELTVVTATRADDFDDNVLAFRVVRQPNLLQLWSLIRSSNIVHIAGPALAPLFLSRLARKLVVVEHHGFQTICPNGQLFIEASSTPCPGHFMSRRHRECLRCNAKEGWWVSTRLWLLTL